MNPDEAATLLRELVWLGELYGERYLEAQQAIACRYLLVERQLPLNAVVRAIHEATTHWPDWRPKIPQIAQVARDIAKRMPPPPEQKALPEPQFAPAQASNEFWRDMVGSMQAAVADQGFTERTPLADPRAKAFGQECMTQILGGLTRHLGAPKNNQPSQAGAAANGATVVTDEAQGGLA